MRNGRQSPSCSCRFRLCLAGRRSNLRTKIENWHYERLFKEADLVVIASAQSTAPADDRLKVKPWNTELLGQTTTLTVKSIVKGKLEGTSIKVLYYKLPDGVLVEDGPLLVSFRAKELLIEGKGFKAGLGPPDYLLFLKARQDGRYESVSGQIDPQLSVREMYQGLPVLSGVEP